MPKSVANPSRPLVTPPPPERLRAYLDQLKSTMAVTNALLTQPPVPQATRAPLRLVFTNLATSVFANKASQRAAARG